MKRVRHFLEYILLYLFFWGINLLPWRVALWVGKKLGDLAFFLRLRKKTALKNLSRRLKKEGKEARKLLREVYQNFGEGMVEWLRFPGIKKTFVEKHIQFENLHLLDKALEEKRGIFMVSLHLGNWELLGAALALKNYPLHFIVGKQKNKWVDGFMNRLRKKMGIKIIPMNFALRQAYRALLRGEIVCMLADQDVSRRGIFVPFLGKYASTTRIPGVLSLRTRASIIPCALIREKGFRYRALIGESIRAQKIQRGREEEIKNLTLRFTKVFEDYVRTYPEQWFWMHKRWLHTLKEGKIIREE